jgi:fatty-acyl-CoA synthase
MKLLSSYGLTECCATVTFCSYDSSLEERANGVGRFIHSVTGSIQNAHGHELPINNYGEICVKGYTIMSGYYNNGMLQTEFTDKNGWFHTGDMGYLDDALNLHVVGRIKNIIICGGENISPKKVEDAILLFTHIDECVVLGVADSYYGEIPCALIQLADLYAVSFNMDELQSFLKEKLERFEIPRRIMVVEQIPKNENGKYDQETIRKLFS